MLEPMLTKEEDNHADRTEITEKTFGEPGDDADTWADLRGTGVWKMLTGNVDFNVLTLPMGVGRRIVLPLEELDKCVTCTKKEGLRVCRDCALVIYCSKECQKSDWPDHKMVCKPTQQIDLKIFYPFIAYLFEDGRHRSSPSDEVHPGFLHKIIKAPVPGARKSAPVESPLHHTVILGEEHELGEEGEGYITWWKGSNFQERRRLAKQLRQECVAPVVSTISVALTLLSEIYSTYYVRPSKDEPWENRPCFRLGFGNSPVVDFGICRGRIQGKTNRVQTWTYYNPRADTRTTFLDPDNHVWLYFRTIKGEELTLDCCAYSLGMQGCIDWSHCLKGFPKALRLSDGFRIPAYFRSSQDKDRYPYTLVEEKRFSVMRNNELHQALRWTPSISSRQGRIIREFISTVQGKPATQEQELAVGYYRLGAGMATNHVLSGNLWKDWEKPVVHNSGDGQMGFLQILERVKQDLEDSCPFNGLLGLHEEEEGLRGDYVRLPIAGTPLL